MKKVLQISIGTTVLGGVEKMLYEIYKNIDKNKVQFDFLFPNYCIFGKYTEDVKNMGAKIIELKTDRNSLKKKLLYNIRLYKFLKRNKYDVVHINSGAFLFVLQVAIICKMAGVKKIIIHSHNAVVIKSKLKKMIIDSLKPILNHLGTDFLACSQLAAESMFSKNNLKNVKIIKNGIDILKYRFDINTRQQYRKKLNIENDVCYVHVGRFEEQKNHKFLIDIFNSILKEQKNAKLIMIGDGELKENITNKIEKYGINDRVLFLNQRNDVAQLLQAMDCFILPSLYEGFPVVGVEAQTSGLPLICSDTITKELKLLETTIFVSLDDNTNIWSKKICEIMKNFDLESRKEAYKIVQNDGYDIKKTANIMQEIYIKGEKNEKDINDFNSSI